MSEPTVLVKGLGIPESPRWHEGRLWFCNWIDRQIVAVDPDGRAEVAPARDQEQLMGYSIDWLPDGRLVMTGDRLRRQEPNGSMVTLAEQKANEIVVDAHGNIYLNGADFNFAGGEAPKPGYIKLLTPDGELRQVAGDIQFPNGMVITPDNRTLIIAESFAGRLTAFDIAADGGLSNRRVFAEGLGPDGICADAEGAVWVSTGGSSVVRVAEGGEILQRVELPENRVPFAVMLGGPDRRTLFIMTAEWRAADGIAANLERLTSGPRTGEILTLPVSVPGALTRPARRRGPLTTGTGWPSYGCARPSPNPPASARSCKASRPCGTWAAGLASAPWSRRPRSPSGPGSCAAAGPGSEECGSEEQFGPGEIGQFFLHGCADRLPRTAHGPLVYGGERPHDCGSELRYPPRRVAGNLEIQHSPAPASGKGLGAVGDDLCALGHLRHGVRGQDRVDSGWEVEAGRVGLHEADIAPAVRLYPVLGAGEHRVGQVDADDPAAGTDHLLKQPEVQACAACHVDHGVTRAKAERSHGLEALRPLGIAGRGIEPGGDVVVLRLLAVCLDQVLSSTVDLGHGLLLDLSYVALEPHHPA